MSELEVVKWAMQLGSLGLLGFMVYQLVVKLIPSFMAAEKEQRTKFSEALIAQQMQFAESQKLMRQQFLDSQKDMQAQFLERVGEQRKEFHEITDTNRREILGALERLTVALAGMEQQCVVHRSLVRLEEEEKRQQEKWDGIERRKQGKRDG